MNHSGEIKLDDLLKFFNHQSTLISKEEGELFFHLASDVKDEAKINLEGKSTRESIFEEEEEFLQQFRFFFYFSISQIDV